MPLDRRAFMNYCLYGSGALALRSIISGIPMAVLANPRRALAQAVAASASPSTPPATFVIYATSGNGDPVNCNVPGTYDNANIYHSSDPSLKATNFSLGNSQVKGAKVWSTLDAATLSNTCFFHHATYTAVHPDETKVLTVNAGMQGGEMLISTIGKQLQGFLGTVQAAPISVSGGSTSESIYFNGAPQPIYSPAQLSAVLTPVNFGPSQLQTIRDNTVDALNAWAHSNATPSQKAFIDASVRSQQQARLVPDTLLDSLSALSDNSIDSQIQAAITLFQMRITPAVSIHLDFGGDNHTDPSLADEILGHTTGVAAIQSMMASIRAANLQDKVTFSMQNVFGRTMDMGSANGRSHNPNHHVSVMIGPHINGGVVGGVGGNLQATGIDSNSGTGSASGDIAFSDTFSAQAKTLCAVTGVPSENIDTLVIGGGAVVKSVLASS